MKNGIFYIFAAAAQAFYKKRSPETINFRAPFPQSVLPYQELLGNYNRAQSVDKVVIVLPYQELLGNYNCCPQGYGMTKSFTIPRTARELQPFVMTILTLKGFTIPRTARELQPESCWPFEPIRFTIPRTARELQQLYEGFHWLFRFTIPRTARELQHLRSDN